MNEENRENLRKAIKEYNATQNDVENRIKMSEKVAEIGSLDDEEVQKAIEILKSNTENADQ